MRSVLCAALALFAGAALALFAGAAAAQEPRPGAVLRGDITAVFDGYKDMRGTVHEWDAGSPGRGEPPDAMLCFDAGGGGTSGGCNEAEARALCRDRYVCRFPAVALPPGLRAIHLLDRDLRAHDHAGVLDDAAALAGFPQTCRIWAPCRIERGWLVFTPADAAARCDAGPGGSPLQRAVAATLGALGGPMGSPVATGRVSPEVLLAADGLFAALDLSPFAFALAREIALGSAADLGSEAMREAMLRSRLVGDPSRLRAALAAPGLFEAPRAAVLGASPEACAALAR